MGANVRSFMVQKCPEPGTWFLKVPVKFYRFLMVFDGFWWFLMAFDGFWWVFDGFLMIFDEFWWFLMVFDGFWNIWDTFGIIWHGWFASHLAPSWSATPSHVMMDASTNSGRRMDRIIEWTTVLVWTKTMMEATLKVQTSRYKWWFSMGFNGIY